MDDINGFAQLQRVCAVELDVKRRVTAQGPAAPYMGYCPGLAESLGKRPGDPYDGASRRGEAALAVRGRLRVIA